MKFSIIIALAPERSAPVLKDIEKLDYSKKDFEVIVEKGYNPSENRNKGIKKAKHEILLFLDDDCNIGYDLLKKAEEVFKQYNPDVLGGPQLTPKDDNFFAKTSGYVISSFFGSHKMAVRYKKAKLNLNADEIELTSAICFIKKEVFQQTEPFNTTLWPGEDTELFARLKNLNFKIIYHPEIYIYHKRRPNFKSFFKQFYNYGRVAVQNEKRKTMGLPFMLLIPTLCVLYTLIYIFLLIIKPFNTIILILSAPFIIYIAIIILMSLFLSIKNKNPLAFLLIPFIYITEHVSYGLGILIAAIKSIF